VVGSVGFFEVAQNLILLKSFHALFLTGKSVFMVLVNVPFPCDRIIVDTNTTGHRQKDATQNNHRTDRMHPRKDLCIHNVGQNISGNLS
jgi:hypothetical protein